MKVANEVKNTKNGVMHAWNTLERQDVAHLGAEHRDDGDGRRQAHARPEER